MRHVQAQAPAAAPRTTLEIYYLDTEGGQATLFVSPSGGSMLVDAGYAGGRDADRIVAAMKEQGVTMLDHVVITHYHGDHVGGAAELAEKVPIRHFYDHGPYTVELQPNRRTGFVSYKAIRDLAHVTVPRVGDTVPLAGRRRAVRHGVRAHCSRTRSTARRARARPIRSAATRS